MRRPGAAAVRSIDVEPAWLVEMRAAQAELLAGQARLSDTVRDLCSMLDRLAQRTTAAGAHGVRDGADVGLIVALGAVLDDVGFTCNEIMGHVRIAHAGVRAALLAADVGTAAELGALLKRLEGTPIAGYVVQRGRRRGAGYVWSLSGRTRPANDVGRVSLLHRAIPCDNGNRHEDSDLRRSDPKAEDSPDRSQSERHRSDQGA